MWINHDDMKYNFPNQLQHATFSSPDTIIGAEYLAILPVFGVFVVVFSLSIHGLSRHPAPIWYLRFKIVLRI